jgi:hypothetical protein
MAKRFNQTEVDNAVQQACIIACVNIGDNPFKLDKIEVHDGVKLDTSYQMLSPGVSVANAVYTRPRIETRYHWESFIDEIERFVHIQRACQAAGLTTRSGRPEFAVAQCNWTEIDLGDDDFEWIQGDWHTLEPSSTGCFDFYDEQSWEVAKVLDEDGHSHPIIAMLRRRP